MIAKSLSSNSFCFSQFYGGEIACWASARCRNEGRSIVLRARIGQKCDFRGTLKKSANNLEVIIGLRSGGLPVAYRKTPR